MVACSLLIIFAISVVCVITLFLLAYALAALISVGAAVLSAISLVYFSSAISTYRIIPAKWKREYLNDLGQEVPTFVLQTALDIKEAIPSAEFKLDIFEPGRKVNRPITIWDDPFLIVCLGGHEFYIEVWNEPGFDTRRYV